MDAVALENLLARDRRSDRPALEDATGRSYDYHWLCTTAWKSGNFLRHSGVRAGVTVGVVGAGPLALLAFLGTALLEGTTRFDPPTELGDDESVRALVAPVDDLESYDLPRGAQRVGYGDEPDRPDVHYFDTGLWSENPSFPPVEIDPETALLSDGEWTVSHEAVLEAAGNLVAAYGIDEGTRVAVAGPLSDHRTVTAGVVAPLLAGGVIVLPGAGTDDAVDLAVGDDVGGADRVALEAVSLD
ncbi:hypothetical protein [Natrialbaceae archaeon AArc-T1-2]|uniref:hypothetical protein n=1 Tax=Natrialbaceae archaeon AArc-T1-2 TaxID=3053904 RepID=UPI00255B1784|nr:hypothetical protein [Natrialbaceae archaeon AArc-T1-2]WIV67643.1 hypothetical protein QQ977_02615 [Natrialbaceae archaeon AArc-T1-2]